MITQHERNQYAYQYRTQIEDAIPPSLLGLRSRRLLKTLNLETLPTLVNFGYHGSKQEIPYTILRECVRMESFAYLNDLAAFLVDTKDEPLKYTNGLPIEEYRLIMHFKGLKFGPMNKYGRRLQFNHYSQVSSDERAVQRALITAATIIDPKYVEQKFDRHDIGIIHLSSDALLRYIAGNPDKMNEAVEIINAGEYIKLTTERMSNIDELITIRRNTANPLRSGAL